MTTSDASAAQRAATAPAITLPVTVPGRYRAVIFDMDGLLLDSEPSWTEAEAELMRRHGVRPDTDDQAHAHGRALADSIRIYADLLGDVDARALELEMLGLMRGHYERGIGLRPGAERLVRGLVGRVPLAVASSTASDLVRLALGVAGLLDPFDVITSGSDLGRPKPHPDCWLAACHALGVEPAEAIAFEDSPPGVRSAIAAGLTVVAVPDRKSPGDRLLEAGAHIVIPSLADVVIEPERPGA